ncbi:hypothetical protein Poli38472_010236 [Pythium oligandrum]|uniref:NADPH-dependent FMN reductase-like domain-containing protein n=1 Tax=Pythium oligandrum TaxID=41045 RepID=A0A8K1CA16_PYTOL|nr:hypothetical protein Poli38472_010236 [Pythium oligandrum]|eukprot:TMW58677.1 hypothetical protein Poli38472_010236 [Pythium oligandrum]
MSSVQPIQLAKAPKLSAVVQSATLTNASSTRVLIVYPSGTHLNQLAGAVTEGALGVIGDASLVRSRLVEDASFTDDVLWADAIILGSHVMNANVEPKMAAFLATWDFSQDLSHKVGAAFVAGGGMSAGEELTMVNLLHSLLIFRMVIVGGERWTSAFGASAVVSEGPFQPLAQVNPNHQTFPSVCYPTDPDQLLAMFRDKAVGLGRRVATLATVMRNPYP